MATFKTFEEISAWQKARELTKEIYKVTTHGAFGRDYGLRDQIPQSVCFDHVECSGRI